MKQTQDYTVRAYRTETKYDTRDNLISLLDVQVPAEALEFLRAAHNAQDSKDVTFTVRVARRDTGDFRKLAFTSKGSKMKDFVPVATLEKWHNPHDNLTELFDLATYDLGLIVQVREADKGAGLFEEGQEEPQAADRRWPWPWVCNAPQEALALPAPEVQDAEFRDLEAEAREFLARCTSGQLARLFAALNFGKLTDPTGEEQAAARIKLAKHLHILEGTVLLQEIGAELARGEDGQDATFTPEDVGRATVERVLSACGTGQLYRLVEFVGLDPTDWEDPAQTAEEMNAEWRALLLERWADLHGTTAFAEAQASVGQGTVMRPQRTETTDMEVRP